jgi:UDP-N-acetylglucosamine:LPS N-acetylglucosamine transferase
VKVARAINRCPVEMQMIVLCGRHEEAIRKLRAIRHRVPVHIEGFTTEVPALMRLADFFIGKPGPGSISEALAMRLPVIVERNQWTLAHERYNADWIVEQQVGMVVNSFSQLDEAIPELLAPARYERYRANAAALTNSAVYEIPELLAAVLASHPSEPMAAPPGTPQSRIGTHDSLDRSSAMIQAGVQPPPPGRLPIGNGI